jgi:hypothetical protein
MIVGGARTGLPLGLTMLASFSAVRVRRSPLPSAISVKMRSTMLASSGMIASSLLLLPSRAGMSL